MAYGPLNDGDTVSHVQRNTWGFTIKAETTGTIGSVRWMLDGNIVATENFAPYAIGGDVNGNLAPFAFSQGAHVVTAIAYSGTNGSGTVLGTITRSFTVTDTPNSTPPTQPNNPGGSGITRAGADERRRRRGLRRAEQRGVHQLQVAEHLGPHDQGRRHQRRRRASAGTSTARIVSTESFAPFAIGGDLNGGADLQPFRFTTGNHTLTVTAFAGSGGTGAVLNSVNVTFKILDQPL